MLNKSPKYSLRFGLFLCVFVVTLLFGGFSARAATPDLQVKSAIAVDANTGQILYQKNDQQKLPIASMTKLLSVYIVLREIKAGRLHWNQQVAISPEIAKMSRNPDLTNVPLSAKRTYTVRELYQASLITSANGAVSALGNAVSGSPHRFIDKMRTTAKQLHLTSAHIVTASGITNGQAGKLGYPSVAKNDENTMSAQDVARLAQVLLKDYPEILQTTQLSKAWFDKGGSSQTRMQNWDMMLRGLSQYQSNLPVDGLKTGTSKAAGGNFTGTVSKHGHRIITVVMHAQNKKTGDPARFVQTRYLMDWVYASYRPVTLNAQTYQLSNVKVPMGKVKTAEITAAKPTTVWLGKHQSRTQLKSQLLIDTGHQEKDGLKAPLAANTTVGKVRLTLAGKTISQIDDSDTVSLPVKTIYNIKQANWLVRTWRDFLSLF
ncbi:D-alanyl-D-alanine carboxypeptidase [Secundilactobacillus pentosiphilus]|uniref:serine-type D-Ala-D-Ala carboxypeptidase n=1 Tax=Secundilactobacillus pentosiphilus TaxID=1714682 RepID=A0A1Z5IQM8_9LACO|nr:serine hydrolase [Secundilactobacillus pentosiphilus]GAX03986.1 D-alanyl-D-alanine carboxypeptidase [Secundilactobacillus pentosiphilus]